jgi:hypothetical protein
MIAKCDGEQGSYPVIGPIDVNAKLAHFQFKRSRHQHRLRRPGGGESCPGLRPSVDLR